MVAAQFEDARQVFYVQLRQAGDAGARGDGLAFVYVRAEEGPCAAAAQLVPSEGWRHEVLPGVFHGEPGRAAEGHFCSRGFAPLWKIFSAPP